MEEVDFQFIIEYAETIMMALGILLLLWIEIWGINKGSKYLKKRILKLNFKEAGIRSFPLLDVGKIRLALKGIVDFLRLTALFLAIYFSLVVVLNLFPATEGIAKKLGDFIFVPLRDTFYASVGYLPKLFMVVIIVAIFRYIVRTVKSVIREVDSGRVS